MSETVPFDIETTGTSTISGRIIMTGIAERARNPKKAAKPVSPPEFRNRHAHHSGFLGY